MRALKYVVCGALHTLVIGCGAGGQDDGESGNTPALTLSSTEEGAAKGAASVGSEVLAAIDFDDGNRVTFERLGNGLLISEVGPESNPKHFKPDRSVSPAEMFRRLAPRREVPATLVEHEQKFGELARARAKMVNLDAKPEAPGSLAAPAANDGFDSERSGQFEQVASFYPWSQFNADYCNFNVTSADDFKHPNATDGHSHVSAASHVSYVAVGADRGNATVQFCADDDCNAPYQLNQGLGANLYYDAGGEQTRICESCVFGFCIGCKIIVVDNYPEVWLSTTNVSGSDRIHDCGWFVPPP